MTSKDITDQFRNAPRLDPTGQPGSNSGIPDQEGTEPLPAFGGRPFVTGQGSSSGRQSPVGGPPTGERLGGHTDRQVPKERLP